MTRVLVTGANGFIGRALCQYLVDRQVRVEGCVRQLPDELIAGGAVPLHEIGEIDATTDWRPLLKECTAVVHLAARVHVLRETDAAAERAYRLVNARATENLARQAAECGVGRFVYLSSIKVNGEATYGKPFTPDDRPNPQDAYARSKYQAEQALRAIADSSDLQVVIIRPPLVYGPGVKGNFLRLLQWVERHWPLPLKAIANRRALLGVENLCDFIYTTLRHPAASGRVWLVADDCELSTPELIERLACGMEQSSRLWPLPEPILRAVGTLLGQRAAVERLCNSLQIDRTATETLLGWHPPYSIADQIEKTLRWYFEEDDATGEVFDEQASGDVFDDLP